ncbi:hypothetical protein KPNJ1_02640 [Klebsiella pneumoniae 30660/NJST258_1]|nr:hypothetical protein KPNJ1_02640 [Klebsiella pneumoniae 30660/NJST258_1]
MLKMSFFCLSIKKKTALRIVPFRYFLSLPSG